LVWRTWVILVAASCITTGSHSILDIVAGFVFVILLFHCKQIWGELLRLTEVIANSWMEWRLGPLRIINHGVYAAAGVFLGMWVFDTLLGPGGDLIVVSVFLCSSLGAALWAQLVEGSSSLLRPLGFYGGFLGGIIGALLAPAFGISIWTALAALSLATPLIQGIGRLRCVVQGCCHGRPTHSVPGIRCTNPNSRIVRLAGLRDVEIHPTPLYSLLWNAFILAVLARLLALHTTSSMICGMYLLLGGLGRFVEEAYRGEPQTLVIFGLRLYQWIAIATIVVGAVLTTFANAPLSPSPQWHPGSLITAFICGILAWFVSAIDFPKSARRFARLT
jgi:prolipoprotein diacylglyceryltransferase